MLSDGFAVYTPEYTSSAELKVTKPSTLRFGPLAYVTCDVEFHDIYRSTKRYAPMQHVMHQGTYRIHRVKKTFRDNDRWPLENEKNEYFTVFTLQEMDPLKIVQSLAHKSSVTIEDLQFDMVLDNRRWMEFVGKTPCSAVMRPNPKDHRDVLRRNVALAAYTSRMCSFTTLKESTTYILHAEEMLVSDINTFYIRLVCRKFTKGWRIALAAPEMREFSVFVGASKNPAIIGIAQKDHTTKTFAYVFYTRRDLHGNTLPLKRAFAVVLGPAVRVQRSRDETSFNPMMDCGDFLHSRLTKEDILHDYPPLNPTKKTTSKENNSDEEESISDLISDSESLHEFVKYEDLTLDCEQNTVSNEYEEKPFLEDLAEFVMSNSPKEDIKDFETWLLALSVPES